MNGKASILPCGENGSCCRGQRVRSAGEGVTFRMKLRESFGQHTQTDQTTYRETLSIRDGSSGPGDGAIKHKWFSK